MSSWQTRYPRPQLRRDSFLPILEGWMLNGNPIKLPFCPESLLSGYEGELGVSMTYETTFTLPKDFVPAGHHVLLHFGAVDQIAEVFLNGRPVVRHETKSFFSKGRCPLAYTLFTCSRTYHHKH